MLELDRAGWRAWLSENHSTSSGCWLVVDRTKDPTGTLSYLDSVEEALCFGWIDSTVRCSSSVSNSPSVRASPAARRRARAAALSTAPSGIGRLGADAGQLADLARQG